MTKKAVNIAASQADHPASDLEEVVNNNFIRKVSKNHHIMEAIRQTPFDLH